MNAVATTWEDRARGRMKDADRALEFGRISDFCALLREAVKMGETELQFREARRGAA